MYSKQWLFLIVFIMGCNDICVIHLVRSCNGIEPLRRFLTSYKNHPAGLKHDLMFILKGFEKDEISLEIDSLLNSFNHLRINVPDEGYDIGSYITAAQLLENKFLCFFNSFSEILDDNWLEKLSRNLSSKGCGMVSATGSWESTYTSSCSVKRKLSLTYWIERFYKKRFFLPFPNPHLRTNGFLISRDLFLDVTQYHKIKDKIDALCFESGKDSISRRIESRGLNLVVVGRDGHGFFRDEWSKSGTFRTGEQENLLVADNQTRTFTDSDINMRILLSEYAWGKNSDIV
jgi:hypothetical protein